jgi:hypothetical protein
MSIFTYLFSSVSIYHIIKYFGNRISIFELESIISLIAIYSDRLLDLSNPLLFLPMKMAEASCCSFRTLFISSVKILVQWTPLIRSSHKIPVGNFMEKVFHNNNFPICDPWPIRTILLLSRRPRFGFIIDEVFKAGYVVTFLNYLQYFFSSKEVYDSVMSNFSSQNADVCSNFCSTPWKNNGYSVVHEGSWVSGWVEVTKRGSICWIFFY